MPNFDKNRIFNESPTKVLKREYENLKQDFSKLNAMKYKQFYENASLSFILENSNYIFTEPYKGVEFYSNIMENSVLPFNVIEKEIVKVTTYISEHTDKMSDVQRDQYNTLLNTLQRRYDGIKNSSCLYDTLMEKSEGSDQVYDDLYEYSKNENGTVPNSIRALMEDENINLLDTINVAIGIPSLYPEMVKYLNECYYEVPKTSDEYAMNAYVTNVVSRMMKDSYFSERVSHIQNMNLRHFLMGLGGVKGSEQLDEILIERVKNFDPVYAGAENSVNRIFEDDLYEDLLEDVNSEEKTNRLLCEKAVLEMNLAFMGMDALHEDTITPSINSIVEQVCIESTTIEKIPQNISGQMKLLEERANNVDSELRNINEKYFSPDGSPGRVVSHSLGRSGKDAAMKKKDQESEPETHDYYTPKKRETSTKSSDDSDDDHHREGNTDDTIDTPDSEDRLDDGHNDDEPEDEEEKKRNDAKQRKTDKYANMDVEDISLESSEDANIKKPEKRPFLQRVQNKALDADAKFQKTKQDTKKGLQNIRNAGKAVAKIPTEIGASIKKTLNDWDDEDDNRRKEYIIQPGYRKKYYKAFQIAITHYVAWAINPLLNIILLISHKLSATKDERIKNELVRELKAEIKVTEEKIEDARANGDQQQKYKLIRIKEKLNAELVRVGANSKFV